MDNNKKEIQSLDELKELARWFSVEDYTYRRKPSLIWLAGALEKRLRLRNLKDMNARRTSFLIDHLFQIGFLKGCHRDKKSSSDSLDKSNRWNILTTAFGSNPFKCNDSSDDRFSSDCFQQAIFDQFRLSPDPASPLSCMDDSTVRPMRKSDAERVFKKAEEEGVDPNQEYRFDDIGIANKTEMHSVTDITMEDQILVDDFLFKVHQYRRRYSIGVKPPAKPVRASNIDKIIRWRILAYIDFLLWKEMEGIEVSSHVAVIFLYPQYEFDSKALEGKIDSLATAALDPVFISNLRAQGLKEQREAEDFIGYVGDLECIDIDS